MSTSKLNSNISTNQETFSLNDCSTNHALPTVQRKTKIMVMQTRHIESISYLTTKLVTAFDPEHYQVTLVYLEEGQANEDDLLAHECVFLGLQKSDYNGLRLKAQKIVRTFLNNNEFDIIFVNMYKPMHLLMQLRSAITASLCVGIIHAFGEFDRLGRRLMMRLNLDQRWKIIGVSAPVRDYLINARCGLTKNNTLVINNAIDTQAVAAQAKDADSARQALALPANGMIFGTVGRCVKGKRHLELVKAFQQFAEQRADVYLVIIGDGESMPALKKYVASQQLQDTVFLCGNVPQALIYMRALDVFVFPSESEGFGLALLEAMALSIPTIVNAVEPLSTIVGHYGIKVDSSNPQTMVAAMECLHQLSATERHQLGAQHAQRAHDFYDIANYSNNYRRLVENHLTAH